MLSSQCNSAIPEVQDPCATAQERMQTRCLTSWGVLLRGHNLDYQCLFSEVGVGACLEEHPNRVVKDGYRVAIVVAASLSMKETQRVASLLDLLLLPPCMLWLWALALSRRFSTTEYISVQWALIHPPPDGFPRNCWSHPSGQPIKTPFTESLKNYCL